MYQVLYRKYRPKSYSDVWGQPQITELLKKQLMTDRLSHAYLFTGSRGIGKTTCAKILAKAVNCLSPKDGNPCNECEICRGIDDERINEVVEMDAASNNGVGDVRDLQERLMFPPTQTKYRVYIIDEVHMLSPSAFNALLKTLEEPPPNVMFILATTEAHQIPATILSRCQRMDFRRISAEDISGRLQEITAAEGGELTDTAALLIGRISDGGMRDAVSLLDQCLARDRHVSEETVRDAAGLADPENILGISASIRERDAAGVLVKIDELHKLSKDMQRLCAELISHYRSLMIINSVKSPDEIIIATTEQLQRLREDAERYPLASIMSIIDTLQTALEHMGKGVDRRTELELALLSICRRGTDDQKSVGSAKLDAMEKRVSALERSIKEGAIVSDQLSQPSAAKPTAVPPAQMERIRKMSDAATPFERWSAVMQELERINKSLFSILNGSQAYLFESTVLVDASTVARDLLRSRDTARITIKQAIRTATGSDYSIGPYEPSARIAQEEQNPAEGLLNDAQQGGVKVNSREN